MGCRFELRLLGPLEAVHDGSPLILGGNRQQVVLAALALHANHVVSGSRLIDIVWGGRPPATARQQVHTAISALRRSLAHVPGWGDIRTEPAGYRLTIAGDDLDLLRFEAGVEQGHRLLAGDLPADAVHAFRTALDVWRGPALSGLEDRLAAQAARLEHARLAALETCLETELTVGGDPRTLADLQEAHTHHPLRERITAALMLALCQAGRQDEANDAYRRTAGMLADQLGADPGPLLAHRFTEVLQGVAAAPAPPAAGPVVPRQLPHPVPGFTGRTARLTELDGLVPAGDDRAMPIVAISGTGGIGKTALAVHWAHTVSGRFPDGQLYVNLQGFAPAASAAKPFEVLGDLLTALGVPADRIPDALSRRSSLYRTLLAGRRALIVLDNARNAEQVRPLLPGCPGCLVLVTSRDRLTGLVAAEGAHAIALDLFSAAEARGLLTRRLGARLATCPPPVTDQIIDSCSGLPLALAMVAARLATNPQLPFTAVAGELSSPQPGLDVFTSGDEATDVRTVLSWSYRTLDSDAARLFRLMGLVPTGPDVHRDAAAALAGLSSAGVRPLLAQLVRVHLVDEQADDRYSLHDLLSTYAAELAGQEDTAADRAAALARLLEHYLHTAVAAARILQHTIRMPPDLPATTPPPFTEPAPALAWLIRERVALITAVTWARDSACPRYAWQLASAIETFLAKWGHWRDLVAVHRVALEAARQAADRAAEAVAATGIAHGEALLGRPEQAQAHLQRAMQLFGELGEHTQEARTLHNLAIVSHLAGQHTASLEHARQALEIFRRLQHPLGEATVLTGIAHVLVATGEYRQAIEHGRLSLEINRRLGAVARDAAVYGSLGYAYHRLGNLRLAEIYLHRGVSLCREAGNRREEMVVLNQLGDAYLASGMPALAREAWQRAVDILGDPEHQFVAAYHGFGAMPDVDSLQAKILGAGPSAALPR